ncbi:Hsp20/alpha crystallin family protein [Aspergillus ibericus CBS 121593]|uniref:30 kDa heat shock protein n=1 Tax=Aspergillus ibericus CBS 121593 TaxID=1448316 RepID=A0A395H0B9_9EURO|nr:30 kDa heat shock protein [Aspergillus ibericus CBS 121593]RAL00755.1 30 kDa heat shock protein [Aspergillus ibericus CBS 121593]
MSLFRTFPAAGEFAPLFRLLDDYDLHRSSQGTPASARAFAPRFDVRETSDGYHLDGELPGINQNDVDIEFSDPQTLVIRGRIEREYHSDNDEAQKDPNTTAENTTPGESSAVIQPSDKQVSKHKSKAKYHYWHSERSVGEFHRTFSFPSRVSQDDVKASLKNGVLSIFVPKAAAPVAKKITIE